MRRASRSRLIGGGCASRGRIEGVSMRYTFDDAEAAERHETQYFEMFGNRGIYHKGWTAVTRAQRRRGCGWASKRRRFDDDVWELYDTSRDWTQAQRPGRRRSREKLHELQRLWPDRSGQLQRSVRWMTAVAERVQSRTWPGARSSSRASRQMLFGGMGRLTRELVWSTSRTSPIRSRLEVEVPDVRRRGRDHRAGAAASGGWSLYAQGRQAEVLLQPSSASSTYYAEATRAAPRRRAPGAHGVQIAIRN